MLGNKLRTWRDPEAVDCAVVGFRQLGVAGGGRYEGAEGRDAILEVARRWRMDGLSFVICEAAPDHLGTIQGEVCRGLWGLEGLMGRVVNGKRMRQSMADGDLKPIHGAAVLKVLDTFMDPSSRDDLDALFELYPDATVEFTCYACTLGSLPARNTIFWEVRNY